jgi:hypothetical protein
MRARSPALAVSNSLSGGFAFGWWIGFQTKRGGSTGVGILFFLWGGGGGGMGLPRTVRPNMSWKAPKAGPSRPYGPLAPPMVSGRRAPPWVPRTGESVTFAWSAGSRERAPWTCERRTALLHSSGEYGGEKSRFGAAHGTLGGGPGLGQVPRPPEPTLLDSAPTGLIPSWGRQHTFWVLGGLSECVECALGAHSRPMRDAWAEGHAGRRAGT